MVTNSTSKSLILGMVIEDLFTDFAKETIHSALNAIPLGRDVRLVVLAGRHDEMEDPDVHRYKKTYNSIYEIEEKFMFDGLVMAMGNTTGSWINFPKETRVTNYHEIPKVFVASAEGQVPYVNYDNESGIREALDFLINVNGFSQVCMLGGRDDNADAKSRKDAFIRGLTENHVEYKESLFEPTDMSVNSHEAAKALLSRNPKVEAIFCINDSVAEGLYEVMKSRDLIPGKDIQVFGFDNTHSAGEMTPTLASVGASGVRLGQVAMEMLIDMIDGKSVDSVIVPTRLYGKESLNYEMYEFTTVEMIRGNEEFIYRMFDECFYRYQNEDVHRETVNLKRLFFEVISRILHASKRRYMDREEFGRVGRMIDIFFENGAMEYTDANKFVQSVGRLQSSMNAARHIVSGGMYINRLFLRMREQALRSLSVQKIHETRSSSRGRERMLDFLMRLSNEELNSEGVKECLVDKFDMIGYDNAALFMFDEPVRCPEEGEVILPDIIMLKCSIKAGELYKIPPERQDCYMSNMFYRDEIKYRGRGLSVYPVFYSSLLYGFLVCELSIDSMERGEYIAGQIGRALYCAHIND